MGYLFPVNPVTRSKTEAEEMAAIERIGEHERNSKNNQDGNQESFDQLLQQVRDFFG